MSFPGAIYNDNPTVAPLESEDVNTGTGVVANAKAAFEGSLGVSLLTKGTTSAMEALHMGDTATPVPYNDAVQQMKAEKLDPSVLPKDQPVATGYLRAVMAQQISIQENQDMAERAHLGAASSFASSLIGGAADPIFLALGPAVRPLGMAAEAAGIGSKGLPLAARVAKGAAEGGAVLGAYTVGEQQFGTAQGNRDITSNDVLRNVIWGGAFGGVLGGAFGKRPAPEADISPYVEMIRTGEDTAAASKASGVPINEVTSSKGAVGEFQVTLGTAKQYGLDPAKLTDPEYNRQAAETILRDLHNKFGDNPEAIAVGYNAGPGWARKFVRAGNDRSILPKETQDYLARIDEAGAKPEGAPVMTADTQQAAAKTAVAQAANDSEVNVEPVIKAQAPDAPELSEAIPKPESSIAADPEVSRALEQKEQASPPPATQSQELADLQTQATEIRQAAEQSHAILNPVKEGEEPTPSPFQDQLDREKEITANDNGLAKGVEAALRCATLKGLSS